MSTLFFKFTNTPYFCQVLIDHWKKFFGKKVVLTRQLANRNKNKKTEKSLTLLSDGTIHIEELMAVEDGPD